MKKIPLIFLSIFAAHVLTAQQSWLIPIGDPLYREAEELFIAAGVVPPYEELPLAAEELKERLRGAADGIAEMRLVKAIFDFDERIRLPFPVISPILEFAGAAYATNHTGRFANVPILWGLNDGDVPPHLDNDPDTGLPVYYATPFFHSTALPPLLKVGFNLHYLGLALHFAPELRETNYGLLQEGDFMSIPETLDELDVSNTPLVGMTSFYSPNFEARFGRGKLHSGPGHFSSLSLSRTMPYFDHVRARFRHEGFGLSLTLVTLNPVISAMESEYLDYLYANNLNPEGSGSANGKIFRDRIKTYINIHLVVRPWNWLSISFMQTNLVGGRPLDLADFNPFLIIHNNFDDGTYSCPFLLSTSVVPVKGLKLYSEFLFYDASAGTELIDPNANPGAIALQAGLTLLSTPFFEIGPGRFRLDFEATYVDPYAYGKFYDLRKFTSRFTYLDQGPGRYWVDYPLGFYLGPDCLDFHASLSYGLPSQWEITLEWQSTGQGEVDLYGYGDDCDYAFTNRVSGPAPTGTPEWTHTLGLGFFIKLLDNLSLNCWYRLSFVYNRFSPALRRNVGGDNQIIHSGGFSIQWKIF